MTGTSSSLIGLLAECRSHGIRLKLDDDSGLNIDAPRDALTPDLLDRLRAHKSDIMAGLLTGTGGGRPARFDPAHPLATFDWDASNGYCPGREIVRHGVHHKREACASGRSWQHVWGERYCSDCWPCTDPMGMVGVEGENSEESLLYVMHSIR